MRRFSQTSTSLQPPPPPHTLPEEIENEVRIKTKKGKEDEKSGLLTQSERKVVVPKLINQGNGETLPCLVVFLQKERDTHIHTFTYISLYVK